MTATDRKAGDTGFADITYDLVSMQYHALKAGHDYEQYVQDAKDAGRDDIAEFMEQVAIEDANRAKQCHEFLKDLSGSPEAGDAVT